MDVLNMKQLYELNQNIKSGEDLLVEYEKSVKTDNILKDLCNILFVNSKPYVYYTIKAYLGCMVVQHPRDDVVRYLWYFVTGLEGFYGRVESKRKSRVDNILNIRYRRSLDPVLLAEYDESVQKIIDSFKSNKVNKC